MKKFGILYICTWKYDVFWWEFYDSCEKNLLVDWNYEKHYFVWTDSDKIKSDDRIHVFYQKDLGRPNNTLKRFHLFLSKKNELEKMDYLFFFNANLIVNMPVWEEILPNDDDVLVVSVTHPRYFKKDNSKFTYDRNPKSTAYIRKGEWSYYVQWWLNWWSKDCFLKMCKILDHNINIDEKNWVIALWHDESHINRYVYDLEMNWFWDKYKVLPPSFLYPEDSNFSFPAKIIMRDKSRYFNVFKVKKTKAWLFDLCLFIVKKILRKLNIR